MPKIATYPTAEQIAKADQTQLARWYRFLESPKSDHEKALLDFLIKEFKKKGGMTPAISKEIGWD